VPREPIKPIAEDEGLSWNAFCKTVGVAEFIKEPKPKRSRAKGLEVLEAWKERAEEEKARAKERNPEAKSRQLRNPYAKPAETRPTWRPAEAIPQVKTQTQPNIWEASGD
jgi:hypothetical protein